MSKENRVVEQDPVLEEKQSRKALLADNESTTKAQLRIQPGIMESDSNAGMYTSISLNDDVTDHRSQTVPLPAGSSSRSGATSARRPTSLTQPLRIAAGGQYNRHLLQAQVEEEEPIEVDSAGVTFDTRSEPRDSYNLVYISMVLAGIGFLLPYNSFVNAVDFYQKRFDSHLIIFDISMTYITVMLISVLLTNLLVNKIHLRWRITFGYMIAIVVLFLTTFFDIILNAFPTNWSYGLTLTSAAVVSLGCTIQQSSFYGYTSLLPRRFTQAVMLGESAAGFIVSMNRIITKTAVASVAPSTALFFILSSCMLLLCLLTFTLGVKSQYVRQFIQPTSGSTASAGRDAADVPVAEVPEDRVRMLPAGVENPAFQTEMLDLSYIDDFNQQPNILLTSPTTESGGGGRATASVGGGSVAAETLRASETAAAAVSLGQRRHSPDLNVEAGLQLRLSVAHSIWLYMSAIALCYLITLSLFPGIESEIPSCRFKDWMPVVLMAVFNGCDLAGKLLAGIPVSWRGGPLIVCSLFRFCLVPLFMSSASPRQKPHISSESWAFFITGLLGLSNGYFGSVPMINAPKTVQTSRREIAGNLMTLSYSVGLTAGSGISYWLDDLLGPIPAKLQTWEYACGFYNVSHVIGR